MLAHLYQRTPCRVLFPHPGPGQPVTAVLLVTSGGIAGGDRLRIILDIGAGAAATVTTQAAEKIYRSLGDAGSIAMTAHVGEGAWLECLPQETILFARARLERSTEFRLEPGARLLACDTLVFGRWARGERFSGGALFDRWQVVRNGRLIWTDALRLGGEDSAVTLQNPFTFGGAEALGSAIFSADEAPSYLELARSLTGGAACKAGATLVNGVLLARFLGEAAAVRAALSAYIGALRHAAAGLPQRMPRLWYN
ncbi:MAG TPA: urease accessory protein UreD [Candidatus Cybelea sp.]|nr:urease accessory protein UreD [Candidatus Cybelea sp.]